MGMVQGCLPKGYTSGYLRKASVDRGKAPVGSVGKGHAFVGGLCGSVEKGDISVGRGKASGGPRNGYGKSCVGRGFETVFQCDSSGLQRNSDLQGNASVEWGFQSVLQGDSPVSQGSFPLSQDN